MAQYRAIFNSAYLKGLATAAVATAALAAGQAQAASASPITQDQATAGEYNVTEDKNENLTVLENYVKSLTIAQGKTFTLNNSGTSTHTNLSSISGDIIVNGTLKLSGSATHNVQLMGGTYNDTDGAKNIITKNFVGNNATVELDKGTISVAKFDMTGGKLTVTGGNATGTAESDKLFKGNVWAYGSDFVMQGSDIVANNADMNLKAVELTVNAHSTVGALDGLNIVNSTVVMNGGNENNKATIAAQLNADATNLQITNSSLEVKGTNNVIWTPKAVIENTDKKVSIAQGATLTFKGLKDVNSEKSNVTIKSEIDNKGTLDLAKADKVVLANATLTNGGTVTLGASGASNGISSLDITGATISNAKDATFTLFAEKDVDLSTAKSISNAGTITFNASGTNVTVGAVSSLVSADGAKLRVGEDTNLVVKEDTLDLANLGTGDADAKLLAVNQADGSGTTVSTSAALTLLKGTTIVTDAASKAGVAGFSKVASDTLTLKDSAKDSGFALDGVELTAINALKFDKSVTKATVGASGILNLGNDTTKTGNANDAVIDIANDGKLNVVGGEWSGLKDVTVTSGAFTVAKDATANVAKLTTTATNGLVTVDGTLNLKGGEDGKVALAANTVTVNQTGTAVLEKTIADKIKIEGETATVESNTGIAADAFVLAGGTLKVDFSKADLTLTAKQIKSLKDALISGYESGSDSFTGFLNIGAAKIQGLEVGEDKKIGWDEITSAGGAGIVGSTTNNELASAEVTNIAATDKVFGQFGSLTAAEANKGAVNVQSNITLNGSAGSDNYAQSSNGDVASIASSGTAANLALQGKGGNVKDITLDDAGSSLTINAKGLVDINGAVSVSGDATFASNAKVAGDSVKASGTLEVNKSLELTKEGATLTATTLNTTAGSSIKADKIALGDSGAGTDSVVAGTITAKAITVANKAANTLSILDGAVKADSLTLSAAGAVIIGQDGEKSASGELDVKTLDLGGGMLLLDPNWGDKATISYVGGADATPDTVKVNGSIGVGKNSVFFAGANTTTEAEKAEAQTIVNRFADANGSLDKNGVGSLFIANKKFEVATGKAVIVDPTKSADDLKTALGAPAADKFILESGAALVVGEELTEVLVADNSKVAIEFASSSGETFESKAGSSIIFDGNVFAGDKVKISDAATVTIQGKVEAANGLLDASNANGTLTFALDKKAADKLYNQSAPVKGLTLDVVAGKFGKDLGTGAQYIHDVNAHDGGKAIEGTARLAVYGGAVQGTALAQQAANDAVVERMSRSNPNGSLVFANNAQGGGLWLSPVYKSHESDSFDADGVDYGVDGDLTGLVLGADSTSESGVRVGGYFNFGSASFDGQGVGDQVSNDADYFGFGLYAGMTAGQFSLLADAGFTQVSNDIEQSVNYKDYSKVKADVDSTAVTLGLRGEYKLNVAAVDVTPHLGVRYTRLAIDSYDAKHEGEILATTDFDTMQMFSIPFGVTVSKDIAAGAWTIKPVFDLTLTANAGDTDAKLNTTFIGTRSVDLTSEAFDSFTYGATLGIDAKYGENFSIGLNTNYTGSSNADEFGVMGNARYMFQLNQSISIS